MAICKEIFSFIPRLQGLESFSKVSAAAGKVGVFFGECGVSRCDFKSNEILLDPTLCEGKIGDVYSKVLEAYVFEMANLSRKSEFMGLIKNVSSLPSEEFVEEFERLEHLSALEAKEIVCSYFPRENWPDTEMAYVPKRFELHYLMQRISGHSQRIFERFFPGRPVPKNLLRVGSQHFENLKSIIALQSEIEDGDFSAFLRNQSRIDRFKEDLLKKEVGEGVARFFSLLESL